MFLKSALPDEIPAVERQVRSAIDARYCESRGQEFGISGDCFREYLLAVIRRYGTELNVTEQLLLVGSLRVDELVLARSCSEGNEDAWREFIARFGGEMRRAAIRIAQSDASGYELAEELYADLYGLRSREGRRASKLDFYMGRGSLAGWLRMVLAQRFVDRCRSQAKETSLEEYMDASVSFPAMAEDMHATDDRVAATISEVLRELQTEDRFLLAAYFLDGQKLAAIGRQLGVHESTACRKLEKVTGVLRKQVRKRLFAKGFTMRQCDEVLEELDVRDLNVDVRGILQQETKMDAF